jgi:hypothetical protein
MSSLSQIVKLKSQFPNSFRIISSFHCYDPKIWDEDKRILDLFTKCYFSQDVDIVKGKSPSFMGEHMRPFADPISVVLQAVHPQTHALRIHHLATSSGTLPPNHPTIAICTGDRGRLARVLNRFLTPVTHPLLPTVAAPGQMSTTEIHQARNTLGIMPKKNFYLFGKPISQSRSPTIHNTAFKLLGLPHQYHLFESEDISEIEKLIRHPDTAGASVTIPHKLAVIPLYVFFMLLCSIVLIIVH